MRRLQCLFYLITAGFISVEMAWGWSEPELVPGLATPAHEFTPWITPDGHTMYYTAIYPDTLGSNDIYIRQRMPDGEWGPAANIGPPVNGAADERAPTLSPDGNVLLFTSEWRAGQTGETDIYTSIKLSNGRWSEPLALDIINTPSSEFTAYPANDGSCIWFTSDRPGSIGDHDIWRMPRVGAVWGEAYNLASPINTTGPERTEGVTHYSNLLLYCSDRSSGKGDMDIYIAVLENDMCNGKVRWISGGINTKEREYSCAYDNTTATLIFGRMSVIAKWQGMDFLRSKCRLPWLDDAPECMASLWECFNLQ